MTERAMEGILPIIIIMVVVFFVVSSSKAKQARARAWAQFAASRGLRFHEAPLGGVPRISGAWGGVPVTLGLEYVGSGKNRKAYTRATARIQAALPRGLSISAEGFADRLIKLIGGQDVQIGLPEVDQKLRIKAEEQVATRRLFQNWRFRQAALAFALCGRKANLSQHQATVAQLGFLSRPDELAGLLELVARCAREVEASLGDEQDATAEPTPAASPPKPAAPRRLPAPDHVEQAVVEEIALPSLAPALPSLAPALPPPPAPSRAPTPPPPVPPASPPPSADAARALDPIVALDRLLRLGDRSLNAAERGALVAELRGRPFPLRMEVERVALSQGVDLPAALEDGNTVVGKPAGQAGPRLVARFPPAANEKISALSWGDHVVATARLVAWDDFYRQAVLDSAVDDLS